MVGLGGLPPREHSGQRWPIPACPFHRSQMLSQVLSDRVLYTWHLTSVYHPNQCNHTIANSWVLIVPIKIKCIEGNVNVKHNLAVRLYEIPKVKIIKYLIYNLYLKLYLWVCIDQSLAPGDVDIIFKPKCKYILPYYSDLCVVGSLQKEKILILWTIKEHFWRL